jgi:hypothetical protein
MKDFSPDDLPRLCGACSPAAVFYCFQQYIAGGDIKKIAKLEVSHNAWKNPV